MGKVKVRSHLEIQDKKKGQDAVGKVVKKKAATLTQKKKETIVQDIISKKDELPDQVTLKKNKIKSNLKEEKKKPNTELKKNRNPSKLDIVSKVENTKSVIKKATKNFKSIPLSKEKHEPQVISKKNKSKDIPVAVLKEKKIKSTVISKKNKKALKKSVISKENKNKIKVVSEKNKKKSKQFPVPQEEIVITKVFSKKEKSTLKKVLVPKDEKNVTEVVSKKNKQKSKVPVVSKEENNELKTISKKAKRKAESDLQKENTRPEVVQKKAKNSKDITTKKKKGIVGESILQTKSQNKDDLISKKKMKIAKDPLNRKNLENSIKALLRVVDVGEQKRRNLLNSDRPAIFLNITCVKVPRSPLHQLRFELPHSLVNPTDDVVLLVKDLKRGRRRSPDDTIHHFEDLLQKHGVNNIKAVISLNQVKTEYRQYEMRRRLLGTYDHFLCDGRISGHLAHLLGKTFRDKRKLPISIHMDKKNLKEEIDRALMKTSLEIHSTGNTYVTQFATCSMSVDEITDNLLSVIQELHKSFPGGWKNVQALWIKGPVSMAIPVYMTLKNKNKVETPVVVPKRPKAYKSVEGELSTFTSNVHVIVAPDGTVDVQKLGGESDDDEENLDEIEEEVDGKNEDAENEVNEDENKDEEKDNKGEQEKEEDEEDEEDDEDDEDDEDEH